MRSAICPGTFDPITLGHESVVRRAAKIFDTVYVAVLDNIDKKTVFSAEERVSLAKKVFADNENIKVITSNGLLADLAKDLGVCAMVKGVRGVSDFDYEYSLFLINDALAPGLETVFIPAYANQTFISSTAVRDIGSYGGDLAGFISPAIINEVAKKLNPAAGSAEK